MDEVGSMHSNEDEVFVVEPQTPVETCTYKYVNIVEYMVTDLLEGDYYVSY